MRRALRVQALRMDARKYAPSGSTRTLTLFLDGERLYDPQAMANPKRWQRCLTTRGEFLILIAEYTLFQKKIRKYLTGPQNVRGRRVDF